MVALTYIHIPYSLAKSEIVSEILAPDRPASNSKASAKMTMFIYFLLFVAVAGLLVSVFCFLKFFASLSSFILKVREAFFENPWEYILTDGFLPALRVWRLEKNARARKVFLKNATYLLGSLTLTMGAMLLMNDLNEKYCVISTTTQHSDGTKTIICSPTE